MVLTFLGMSYQYPPAGSVDNVPNTDHRVVAARNESTSPCGKGTDGMLMTFKVQLMIWVFVDVLLRNNLVNPRENCVSWEENAHPQDQYQLRRRRRTYTRVHLAEVDPRP